MEIGPYRSFRLEKQANLSSDGAMHVLKSHIRQTWEAGKPVTPDLAWQECLMSEPVFGCLEALKYSCCLVMVATFIIPNIRKVYKLKCILSVVKVQKGPFCMFVFNITPTAKVTWRWDDGLVLPDGLQSLTILNCKTKYMGGVVWTPSVPCMP